MVLSFYGAVYLHKGNNAEQPRGLAVFPKSFSPAFGAGEEGICIYTADIFALKVFCVDYTLDCRQGKCSK